MGIKYLDGSDFCQWCSKELSRADMERAKHFCSNDCRYKYHNAQKKIERERSNALRAIRYIHSMMLKNGELANKAYEFARDLNLNTQVLGVECKCAECGQHRLFLPMKMDRCDFCQAQNWIFFEQKKLQY